MNSDSIISLLLLAAFFILPSILKQIKAKKKDGSPLPVRKKISILGRLYDQVRRFIERLEEQALQQKQTGTAKTSIWETLAEDEKLPQTLQGFEAEPDIAVTEPKIIKNPVKIKPDAAKNRPEFYPARSDSRAGSRRKYRFKTDPLQNAVILSEILSRPVALRD